MRTKTVLENVDELFRAVGRNRPLGDTFPLITGTLIFDGTSDGGSAYLQDANIEWSGTIEEITKEAVKRAGFDLHWT